MKWMRYAKLALLVSVVLGTATTFAQAEPITVEAGLIKVRNTSYEIDFSATSGAITAIRDARADAGVSDTNGGHTGV